MRLRIIVSAMALSVLLGCCNAPSPEQIAAMTVGARTPTPAPSPTATPVPYDLTAHVTDESGAPLAKANIVLVQLGTDKPFQTDASGTYAWTNLPGPAATLKVSAPGYFDAVQGVTMERGFTEIAVSLRRDPSYKPTP